MKYGPLALSYDYGTQSVRAILFDKQGEIRGKVKLEFKQPYISDKPGYAEQSPEFYWGQFCRVTNRLKEDVGELWNDIVTMSITTFRDTVTCLDKDMKPLRPFILYLDQRRVENPKDYIPSSKRAIFKMVNMFETASAQFAACFGNWISINEPEIWAKTEKLVSLSTYIHYRLLDELIDSVANQVGHLPFNYKKKVWLGENDLTACIFGKVTADKMVQKLIKPCEVMGHISKAKSLEVGLPEGLCVIASGADKACETLAVGCVGNDIAAISMGTAASVEITTDKYVEPQPFMPAYPSIYNDKFNPEIMVFRGYWMISWFKNEFALREVQQAKELGCSPEQLLDARLSEVPAGCEGLVLQPYWSPGANIPEAKGAIIGFSDCHTRVHIYRAIIEGIGFALLEGLKNMERRAGYNIKRIAVSGGGSNSEQVCQITADLSGKIVQKVQTYETSALGAAMAAFTGVGEYKT
ncbi:MAG: FGGY-family carbohydrate kinase, partial [Clostridia bacterium]